jgi:phosphonate transport system substrate-binding protein
MIPNHIAARMTRAFSIALLLMLPLAACGDAADGSRGEDVFRLGFLPAERGEQFDARAERLGDALSERMGIRVQVFVPNAYEPLIEALRFGNLEAAFMDAAPAWIAHERAGVEVVLAEIRADGRTFYYGTGFTRNDTDIEDLEDLLGKRVAHTSWTGSSGFVLPIGTMIDRGLITPRGREFPDLQRAMQDAFASYTMAGGYKAAMEMLVRGQVDVAFGADDAAERFLDEGQQRQVREFVRLGRVPSHPVVVANHVSEERRQAFVDAMLSLSDEHPEIFRELYGVEGVVATTTEEHLGDFGPAVRALPGLHGQFLDRTR